MSGSFSKEQRRNLIKAVGTTAFEAMEQARQLAYLTETRAAAIAKEFLNFERTTRETVERQDALLQQLTQRCDGLGQWSATNEAQADQLLRLVGTLTGRLDATDAEFSAYRDQMAKWQWSVQHSILNHVNLGWRARLRWVLFGNDPIRNLQSVVNVVPAYPDAPVGAEKA